MRSSALVVAVASVVAPITAHAQAYIEKFLGWSRDGTFYAITESGIDEIDTPALCASRRGDHPAAWPSSIPLPDADNERGCNEDLIDAFPNTDQPTLVAKVQAFVVAPADKPPHGETVDVKAVGDGTIIGVTVSHAGKPLGRAYFSLRAKGPVPNATSEYWRADGLAVAVEASYATGGGGAPPQYLVVIALDGSTAAAPRPPMPREQSRALNLDGMKLLQAHRLSEAQRQFAAAAEADPSFSIALYNLASVASLREDRNTAITAIEKVVDLARSDAEAKRALAHGKTDHDLDFVASQSPYTAQLLGRPRTPGDDWCIAAEKRARAINPGNFIGLAEEAAPLVEPGAAHAGIPAGKDPELACTVNGGKSQLSITMYIALTPKGKPQRVVTIAWEIFPDGMFDADAFLDDKHTKTARLQKLDHVVRLSHTIAGR